MVNALPTGMMIQTIGSAGKWIDVNIARLKVRTGADPASTVAQLYDHVVNCFPHDDWRLLGDDGQQIDEAMGY